MSPVTEAILPPEALECAEKHTAVFYLVKQVGGDIVEPEQFEGQDSFGAGWVAENEINADNASPLVLKAMEWLRTESLGLDVNHYPKFVVKKDWS